MHRKSKALAVWSLLAPVALIGTIWQAQALAGNDSYPAVMASVSRYLMPEQAEIALARSAAPSSISADATVMVLGSKGYTVAVKGRNGFLCLVERSWGAAVTDPDFWGPEVRGPICFNPAAARTFAPVYLMKTRLALAGKSKPEIAKALTAALKRKNLPALAPGAMCYMMSPRQVLADGAGRWHPHLMFYVAGNATQSWGADRPGSPVLAAYYPEARATILMVVVDRWSDGTPAPQIPQ